MPTILPSSSTMILFASSTVLTLWATMIMVAPAVSLLSAIRNLASVLKSSAEKLSSNRYISGFLTRARAIESLCFCPPDTLVPPCEITESKPSFMVETNSIA